MKTFLIFKKENENLSSNYCYKYQSDVEKDSPGFFDYSLCSPLAIHLELPEGKNFDEVSPQLINDVWVLADDQQKISAKAQRSAVELIQRKIQAEEMRIDFGFKIKAYFGYLCELNGYTSEDFMAMLSDETLSLLSQFLMNGALEASLGLISTYAPTSYMTEEMVNSLSAKLQEYIMIVNDYLGIE